MYISTRGGEKLTASQAILKGLACDGGLFLPENIKKLNIDDKYFDKNYLEIAKDVFSLFLDDFTEEEIDYCISGAYNKENFANYFTKLTSFNDLMFLELYHGPTLAFKDMALTILPFLIEVAKKKNNVLDKSLILVATSGDTGGAALSSFMKNDAFDTVVLYPDGGVSEIQEKQMLYYTNERTHAYAIKGNFDDCQSFVKSVFSSYPKDNGILLSSANSINIGRLVPQIIYYVYAYCKAVKNGSLKKGEEFTICVPTGNFGDIFAGYLASLIGVPISKFICASNVNNVLTDFFKTGVYDKNRQFKKSNSPAMDILISSNLERLVYMATGSNGNRVKELMQSLNETGKYSLMESEMQNLSNFGAGFTNEEDTVKAIKKAYDELGYLIDPHTAVAYDCYNKLPKEQKTLIISTASPFKFPYTMAKALSLPSEKSEFEIIKDIASFSGVKIPYGIKKLEKCKKKTILKTKEDILDIVTYNVKKYEVIVPCSSANLGCSFDCSGVALSLYNSFFFEKSEKDEVEYGNLENNLMLKAYKIAFEKSKKPYIPVKITQGRNEVPSARGLGSSSTCIVAGVIGANLMLKNYFKKQELLEIMTEIEGHPDNVAPAFLGGFVTSCMTNENVFTVKNQVSNKLKVLALIPDFELSTKKARAVLPQSVSLKDAIHNLCRSAITSEAFLKGDMQMIKAVFDDKIHQPARLPLIKGSQKVIEMLNGKGYAVAISGAGSTLLAVGLKNSEDVSSFNIDGVRWTVKKLRVDEKGATFKKC
ncbi:MAG: threonine synthase [Clostridia bacterium]|nr:threonine synthase [Clostridia bacterium]